jgi:pimeloyl-ACP methyl ester carboxylesterase
MNGPGTAQPQSGCHCNQCLQLPRRTHYSGRLSTWDDRDVDTRTVTVGNLDVAIAEAGLGGQPLLLLHGFTGAKEDFSEWLDRLASAGWHAVAPDHRGHGATSKPSGEEAYSVAVLAADALALADALRWTRFVLLGHSMGGFVAQHMAISCPERLRALVLMDTAHGMIEGIQQADVALAVDVVRSRGMGALADILAERIDPLETAAHRRLLSERPGYREFGDRKFRATSPDLYAAMLSELLRVDDRLALLRGLPASLPTLVIVGEQDARFVEPSRRMAEAIRGARLAVIADAGHSPQFENPDGWWQALSRFLDGLAGSAS